MNDFEGKTIHTVPYQALWKTIVMDRQYTSYTPCMERIKLDENQKPFNCSHQEAYMSLLRRRKEITEHCSLDTSLKDVAVAGDVSFTERNAVINDKLTPISNGIIAEVGHVLPAQARAMDIISAVVSVNETNKALNVVKALYSTTDDEDEIIDSSVKKGCYDLFERTMLPKVIEDVSATSKILEVIEGKSEGKYLDKVLRASVDENLRTISLPIERKKTASISVEHMTRNKVIATIMANEISFLTNPYNAVFFRTDYESNRLMVDLKDCLNLMNRLNKKIVLVDSTIEPWFLSSLAMSVAVILPGKGFGRYEGEKRGIFSPGYETDGIRLIRPHVGLGLDGKGDVTPLEITRSMGTGFMFTMDIRPVIGRASYYPSCDPMNFRMVVSDFCVNGNLTLKQLVIRSIEVRKHYLDCLRTGKDFFLSEVDRCITFTRMKDKLKISKYSNKNIDINAVRTYRSQVNDFYKS